MKKLVIAMEKEGLSIAEISKRTSLSLTEVCNILREQYSQDQEMPPEQAILSLVKIIYKRVKKGEKICFRCYLQRITNLLEKVKEK